MSSAGQYTTNKPRKRQRIYKAPAPVAVPDIHDDAAERKRALNVLAQRRYRERKRQSRQASSKHNGTGSSQQIAETTASTSDTLCGSTDSTHPSPAVNNQIECSGSSPDPDPLTLESTKNGSELDADAAAAAAIVNCDILSRFDATEFGNFNNWFGSSSEYASSPPLRMSLSDDSTFTSPQNTPLATTIDPMVLFGTAGGGGAVGGDGDGGGSRNIMQADNSSPELHSLPVLSLNLLRAFMRIAARLGCANANLWDINALSPFSDLLSPTLHLPKTWQPTTAQLLIPHHPLLDFLPWPSVREKILYIFTLPEDMRPAVAQVPTALVQFVYDLEHSAEGVRIWGEDIYDPSCWEVGQVFFEKWWFLFDSEIIKQSNYWRERRGAAKLRITSGHARP